MVSGVHARRRQMDKLRDEIIEAQKIRADLIKWKLVLVFALVTISGGGQTVVAAEPEQRAGKLEHPEVVLRFLLPADQNPPTLR